MLRRLSLSATSLTCFVLVVSTVGLARPTSSRAAAATRPAYGTVSVQNAGASGVMSYPAGDFGTPAGDDAAPSTAIVGSGTGLDGGSYLAAAPDGALWASEGSALARFTPGANGNVAPTTIISGPHTGLSKTDYIRGIAVAADGTIWVTVIDDTVEEFAADATGDATPLRVISGDHTDLDFPQGIAIDPDGSGVWVASGTASDDALWKYALTANGNVAPIAEITGTKTTIDSTEALAINGSGALLVLSSWRVLTFASGSTGNVAPVATLNPSSLGSEPDGIAVDALGNVYVDDSANSSIEKFPPEPNGNVSPTGVVAGAETGLDGPHGIAVFAVAPSAPNHLTDRPANHSVTLSWKPPSVSGGAVLGYLVERATSAAGPWTTLARTDRTTYANSGTTNGRHYRYRVLAYNGIGISVPSATVTASSRTTPSRPRHVRAKPGRRSLRITWKSPSSNGGAAVTSYRVSYATCKVGHHGCRSKSKRASAHSRHLRLRHLKSHRRYYAEVVAINPAGAGKVSHRVSARTKR